MKLNFTTPILILAALLIGVGFIAAKGYEPQDFAEARTQDALQAEDVRHAAEMNVLAEQSLSNVNANVFQRRLYMTFFVIGSMCLLFLAGTTTAAGYSVYAVATTVRMSLPQIAEGKKRYTEIMRRPNMNQLPDGTTIIELPSGNSYLRDITGQVSRIENTPANPELVQVLMARIAAGVAVEQSKHSPRGKVEVIK